MRVNSKIFCGLARSFGLLAGIAILFSASGCSRLKVKENQYVNQAAMNANPPKTMAILPFVNSSGVPDADEEARISFYSALSSLNYEDIELDEIDSELCLLAMEHNLRPEELPPPLVREIDLADALLSGEVINVSKRWLLFYSHIKLKLRLKLIDSRTLEELYTNEISGKNFKWTTPMSILGIVKSVFGTWLHLGKKQENETFEELAQKIATTFPETSKATAESALAIHSADFLIPRDPARPGDQLKLIFHGTPGQRPSFDLGTLVLDIPMTEISPGKYGVTYTIPPGLMAPYCALVCKLKGPNGVVHVELHEKTFGVDSRIP